MLRKLTLPLLPLLVCSPLHAAVVLGDVQIIGYRSDDTVSMSFVVWTDLAAGEEVFFTDSGFFDDDTLRDDEARLNWTAPAGGVAAGTVVVWQAGAPGADLGTSVGGVGLGQNGDQIFAGSTEFPVTGDTTKPGTSYTGALVHGLNYDEGAWAADAVDNNTSALPTALVSALDNITLPDVDNGQYTGPRTTLTSLNAYRLAIDDPSNWTQSDNGTAFGALNSTDFVIVPEPTTVLPLGALLGIAVLGVRRRRSC